MGHYLPISFIYFVMSFSFLSIFKRVVLKFCLVNPIFVLPQDCFCSILSPLPPWIGNICFFACCIILLLLLKSGHFDYYNVQAIKKTNKKITQQVFLDWLCAVPCFNTFPGCLQLCLSLHFQLALGLEVGSI